MACSRFEYVKNFEAFDAVLPQTFIVVRVDGRGFTKFTEIHGFEKPNDPRGLQVMNKAAEYVFGKFQDMLLAYGQSDEYSFVFSKHSEIFQRRREKIVSTVVSMFTACYVSVFEGVMGKPLVDLPTFDCRLVCYPSEKILQDYFSWRQADCHINNLYNYCFWTLVQKGKMDRKAAEKKLSGTLSDFKNEMLYSEFGIKYGQTDAMGIKGTVIKRSWRVDDEKMKKYLEIVQNEEEAEIEEKHEEGKGEVVKKGTGGKKISPPRKKQFIDITHEDIISDLFWERLLGEGEQKK